MQQPTTCDSLETRLERLEHKLEQTTRRERNYRFALTATLGFAGVLALLAATDITRIDAIRTHRLEILDDEGRVMLAAGTDTGGGRLDLWSSTGANLMRLGANEHGGDLAVWSATGTNVAGAWATESGGSVAAWNESGKRAATMAAGEHGGMMTLAAGDAESKLVLDAASSTPLAIIDGTGVERLTLAGETISLRGGDGTTGMSLQLTEDGGGLRCGSTSIQLLEQGGLNLQQSGQHILQAAAADGETILKLAAPEGTATVRASADAAIDLVGARATLTLAGGDTESVTVASDPDAAIIKTSDEAISLYASHGAGRMVLGSGEGGQVRITGGVDGLAAAVDVLAPGSTRMATLSTTKSGLGLLAVCDSAGTPVGMLHGAGTGRGRLSVRAPGGTAVADAASDGTPEFALMTTDGRTTAALAATVRGGALNLMNVDGTPVVLAGITSDGPGGAAAFQNGAGKTVVAIGSTKDDVGRVVVD
ncbi:MAG: hypothetical protein QF534_06880 [Phycisphaerales bacterium]|nr:hypothetical protein [Phycisphaerales bacterium]